MQDEIETVGYLAETAAGFLLAYGFQILGALVFLLVGLKASAWLAARTKTLLERRHVDQTLARFTASAVRIVLVAFLVIATLSNFGVSVAPLIAMAGAAAFGVSVALQGPLSNYAAGLSIILSRPFVVGDTLSVREVSGVVEDVTLAATIMRGEDGERITIPNRQIVGQILINSDAVRIVEARLCIPHGADADRVIALLRSALATVPGVSAAKAPQVGIEDFAYPGLVLGLRYWVPSQRYFATRYAANAAAHAALAAAGVTLAPIGRLAFVADMVPAAAAGTEGKREPSDGDADRVL